MPQPPRDRGFTLLEVLTTMALLGIVMAIAVGGWSSWARSSAHSGAARELLAVLRQAQQRAVTDGKSTCVSFTTGLNSGYKVAQGACPASTPVLRQGTLTSRVSLGSPSFTKPGSPDPQPFVQFNSRGSGWPGTLKVKHEDSATTVYTLRVEVLTGHVALEQN